MENKIQFEELLNMTAIELYNKVNHSAEQKFLVIHGEKVFLNKQLLVTHPGGLGCSMIVRLELEEVTHYGKEKIKGSQNIIVEKRL